MKNIFLQVAAGAAVAAVAVADGPVPQFLSEQTRKHPTKVENHDLRAFARREFGSKKDQALVSVVTKKCAADTEKFQKGIHWELQGLATDASLKRSVIGEFGCLHPGYAPICEFVFGSDINERDCQIFLIPPSGNILRFEGDATEKNLKNFVQEAPQSAAVDTSAQFRFDWVSAAIEYDNLSSDISTLVNVYPAITATGFTVGVAAGFVVSKLL